MSYTALYRKFRPQEFGDVRGQDAVVTTLKNQIEADRIGHAYLFCGTRGTGKTSIAKIFAKAVNCEHPKEGSPCGECASCKAVAAGTSMNVIEIDAASNNGVESIRQIREEVAYRPTEGKFKVYIIDEVHMLSIGAFNALLKTLEEPPSYVIFILATTEVHKIPVTILSRCQRYDFKRISVDTICGRLEELLEKEGIEAEEKAIRYIARSADGAMRDALSLLDQCIAFYLGKSLTYEKVLEVLGAVDTEVFSSLLRSILKEDVQDAMKRVEDLVAQGRELGQFITDFTWYLRNLLLVQSSEGSEDVLDMSGENLNRLREEAQMAEDETIIRYIRIFSQLSGQVKYSSQKRVLLEVALIKLCRPQMERDYDSLIGRIEQLEKQIAQGIPVAATRGADSFGRGEPTAGYIEKKEILEEAVPEDIKEVVKNWRQIIGDMSSLCRKYLSKAVPSLGTGGELLVVFDDALAAGYFSREEEKRQLEQVIAEHVGKGVAVLIKQNESGLPAGDAYVDLEQVIHMDITYEEE